MPVGARVAKQDKDQFFARNLQRIVQAACRGEVVQKYNILDLGFRAASLSKKEQNVENLNLQPSDNLDSSRNASEGQLIFCLKLI